jgi:hypothetical protein
MNAPQSQPEGRQPDRKPEGKQPEGKQPEGMPGSKPGSNIEERLERLEKMVQELVRSQRGR